MGGKVKPNSCSWLAEHFSTVNKNTKHSVQIIEWQGNDRTTIVCKILGIY